MPTIYKRTGVQGTANVDTYATLYPNPASPSQTVPSGTSVVLSTLAIVNTGGSSASYRIGFATSAIAPVAADWLVYGGTVPANDTVFITVGVTMQSGSLIRVSSSANTVTFQCFVSEIT